MIKWMLPLCTSNNYKEPFISHNAKYHCFIADEKEHRIAVGKSVCGKYIQDMDYDTEIKEFDIYYGNPVLCKKCLERYSKHKER